MKLYLDSYGKWWLGDTLVNFKVRAMFSSDKVNVTIYSTPEVSDTSVIYSGPIAGLTDNIGTSYTNYDGLMAACADFFDYAPGIGAVKNLLIAKAKVTINDTNAHSIFSTSYAGRGLNIKGNSLRSGDMVAVEMNGLFTSLAGATSDFRILFGNTELFSQNITYLNNRTNYVISQRVLITFREIGTSGVVILQGFTSIQTSETQFTSAFVPVKLIAPVSVNTTIDNLFDMTFRFNNSGNELIVSNAIVQKLRA